MLGLQQSTLALILPAALNQQNPLPFKTTKDGRAFIEFTPENGNKISLEYYNKDPDKGSVKSVYFFDQEGNNTKILLRNDPKKNEWNTYEIKNGVQKLLPDKWVGNYRASLNQESELQIIITDYKNNPSYFEKTIDLKGNASYQRTTDTKAKLSGDANGILSKVERADGTSVTVTGNEIVCEYIDYSEKSEKRTKQTISWSFDKEKQKWTSNQGKEQSSSPLSPDGTITFINKEGLSQTIFDNGVITITNKDGSKIKHSQNSTSYLFNYSEYRIEFDTENKIQNITLIEKGKKKALIDSTDVIDLKFGENKSLVLSKKSGSQIFLYTNLSHKEINAEGQLIEAVNSFGSKRTFEHDNSGNVIKIKEVLSSSKEEHYFHALKNKNGETTSYFIKSKESKAPTFLIDKNIILDDLGRITKINHTPDPMKIPQMTSVLEYKDNTLEIIKLTTELKRNDKIATQTYTRSTDKDYQWEVARNKDQAKTKIGNILLTDKADLAIGFADTTTLLHINGISELSKNMEIVQIPELEIIELTEVDKNGSYDYKEAGIAKTSSIFKLGNEKGLYQHPVISEAREELLKTLTTNLQNSNPARLAQIKSLMVSFEYRMLLLGDFREQLVKGEKTEIAKEVRDTYRNLSSLINENKTSIYKDKKDRLNLAEQILCHVAEPRTINQGMNPTCNITTVEIYTAAMHPANYSNLIRNVVQNYSLIRKDAVNPANNNKVYHLNKIPTQALQMQNSSYNLFELMNYNNLRTPASTIFQISAINATRIIENSANYVYVGGDPQFNFGEIINASEYINGKKMPYLSFNKLNTYQQAYDDFLSMGVPVGISTEGGRHVQVVFPQLGMGKNGKAIFTGGVHVDNSNGPFSEQMSTDGKPPWMHNFKDTLSGQLGDLKKIFGDQRETISHGQKNNVETLRELRGIIRGKDVKEGDVLEYGATWCGPCQTFNAQLRDNPSGNYFSDNPNISKVHVVDVDKFRLLPTGDSLGESDSVPRYFQYQNGKWLDFKENTPGNYKIRVNP